MACPTCDHTMHAIEGGHFWCPRCGTLKDARAEPGDFLGVPAVVTRCRAFEKLLVAPESTGMWDWSRLGIREAINLPGDRP